MDYQKEQQLRNCLARNLRYLRMSRIPCLSQKMLARKLGVTQKSISRYENAKYLPPTHVLVALADEFGLAMDELFMEHLPMLDTYDQHQIRDDLIVCTNTGNFPTSRNIQETLDRILRKCGLPHYGTHSLRHTFIRIPMENMI